MFNLAKLFRRNQYSGVTIRNSYLEDHGHYLAMEKKKSVFANEHSAPQLPYALADILFAKISKEQACSVRWDIYTYRWALHTFRRTSSSRISLRKKSSSGHRHFVRDGEVSAEQLTEFTQNHLKKFDLVIFDGPDKTEEVEYIIPTLSESGIVVMVDDFSDGYDFETALKNFHAAGFRSLIIKNPAPLFHELTGAIIYRDNNFLGL